MRRTALVTGATGCIGTAICRRLSDDGMRVVGHYRSSDATRWLSSMARDGYQLAVMQCDIRNYADVERMAAEVFAQFGPIQVLVNNAGIVADRAFHKMPPTDWVDVINTNLVGTINVTHCFYSGMRGQRLGRIINISSVNGRRGQFGQTNYCASKAGIHGFTKSLALECAAKGITVNTVSPGYVKTDMVEAIPKEHLEGSILPSIPMGRLAEAQEIADLVGFLASPEANYITGAELSINGGQHVH